METRTDGGGGDFASTANGSLTEDSATPIPVTKQPLPAPGESGYSAAPERDRQETRDTPAAAVDTSQQSDRQQTVGDILRARRPQIRAMNRRIQRRRMLATSSI